MPNRSANFIILDLHPQEVNSLSLSLNFQNLNINSDALFTTNLYKVARQMTLIDFSLFSAIEVKEYFRKSWMKADSERLAPSVIKWIAHFNKVCGWVATEIIVTPNPKQRATVIQTFIDIAGVSVVVVVVDVVCCVRCDCCQYVTTEYLPLLCSTAAL